MTITSRVREQMFQPAAANANSRELIRIPVTRQPTATPPETLNAPLSQRPSTLGAMWTSAEHERFLEGLELFPSGPWKCIAEYVGTKTPRQTMSHAQKYRQKIDRDIQARGKLLPARTTRTVKSAIQSPVSQVTVHVADVLALQQNREHLQPECEPASIIPLWDPTLPDPMPLESFNGCYDSELSDDDYRLLFDALMEDANSTSGVSLLHESETLPPSSLHQPHQTPLTDISTREFDFMSGELMHVGSDDIHIWFGQ